MRRALRRRERYLEPLASAGWSGTAGLAASDPYYGKVLVPSGTDAPVEPVEEEAAG